MLVLQSAQQVDVYLHYHGSASQRGGKKKSQTKAFSMHVCVRESVCLCV